VIAIDRGPERLAMAAKRDQAEIVNFMDEKVYDRPPIALAGETVEAACLRMSSAG
jgi:threonine dehydrogenase-like Zn-dependent dehydrogenase